MAKRRLKKPSPTPFLRWNKRSRRGVPAKSETNHRNANRSSVRKGLLSVHDGGPFCLAVILQLRGCWVDIVCEVNLGGYAKFHLIRLSAFQGKADNHLPLRRGRGYACGMAAGLYAPRCSRFGRSASHALHSTPHYPLLIPNFSIPKHPEVFKHACCSRSFRRR